MSQRTVFQSQTTYYQQINQQPVKQLEAQVAEEWQVGDVILDLYEITALLGEGGMGKVFRAHHRDWNIDLKVNFPKAASFSSAQHLAASQVCKSQAGGNDLETFPWRPNALIEGEFCHECPKT